MPVAKPLKTVDLLAALRSLGGPVLEKVGGLTVGTHGEVDVVTDNDAVNDSTGETHLTALGKADDLLR